MDQFTNQAEIYFDLEEAVATNTVTTTLIDCALWQPVITVHPFGHLGSSFGDHYQWFLDGMPLPGSNDRLLMPGSDGDYTVEVTSLYGCTATSEPYTQLHVGVPEPLGHGLSVAPSPFRDLATVRYSGFLASDDVLVLTDLTGRELRHWRPAGLHHFQVDREDLPSGMYCLSLRIDGVRSAAGTVVIE
jgi:hypothetical protein